LPPHPARDTRRLSAQIAGVKHLIPLLALCAAACGPDDKPAPSAARQQIADNPAMAASWPLLLQHCLRLPSCDPMGEIGDGAGEASGQSGGVYWLALTPDAIGDGALDDGAAIHISIPGPRGQGGPAGRPMQVSEMPATLRARRDRNSWLTLVHRIPDADAPRLVTLYIGTTHIALPVTDAASARTRPQLTGMTADWLDALVWPDGQSGARIEIIGQSGVLFTAHTSGLPGDAQQTGEQVLKQGYEPWVFSVSHDLGETPLPDLAAALEAGETLSLRVSTPDGAILTDAFYAGGYGGALARASASLSDPEIGKTIGDRCTRFADEPDTFWKVANVTPALEVCDPRTPEQKLAAERGSAIGVSDPSEPAQ
jgi:hypothetical protein